MKIRKISIAVYFLFLAMLTTACGDNDNDDLENPGGATEENTVAKYSLTLRGQTNTWTDENPNDADFSLHQIPTDTEGYYTMGISMSSLAASSSQPSSVSLSGLIGNKAISSGVLTPGSYALVHIGNYADEKECFDNPQSCLGVGTALVAGTEPSADTEASMQGWDNDVHSQSGTLTITAFTITENEGGVIKGLVSGKFNVSGINTNGSKPNPGTASGSFENAPFETLAFE